MAIVNYTCDTCKRTITLPQNRQGFEVFTHCIITENCRGSLKPGATSMEILSGPAPVPDALLPDWIQRKILYTYTKTLASSKWNIKHNLNNLPEVLVYVQDLTSGKLVPTSDYTINYTDVNNLSVVFPLQQSGIAQCIARYNNTVVENVVQTSNNLVSISQNSYLTVAVSHLLTEPVLQMIVVPPQKSITYGIPFNITLNSNNASTAWGDINTIYNSGKTYSVYAFPLPMINNNPHSFDQYTYYFSQLNGSSINKSDMLILLSTGVTSTDKTYNLVVDSVILENNNQSIINNNVAYINQSLIKTVYPPITVVS